MICTRAERSDRIQMLGGQWRFRYFESIDEVPGGFHLADDALAGFIDVPVPSV